MVVLNAELRMPIGATSEAWCSSSGNVFRRVSEVDFALFARRRDRRALQVAARSRPGGRGLQTGRQATGARPHRAGLRDPLQPRAGVLVEDTRSVRPLTKLNPRLTCVGDVAQAFRPARARVGRAEARRHLGGPAVNTSEGPGGPGVRLQPTLRQRWLEDATLTTMSRALIALCLFLPWPADRTG